MKRQNLITAKERSMFESGYRVMHGSQEFVTFWEDMSFRVWYETVPDYYSEHFHTSVEVVLPHEGECHCTIGDTTYCVGSEEVLFIPSDVSHSLSMPKDSVRNLILFDPACLMNIRGVASVRSMMETPVYLKKDDPVTGQVRHMLFELIRDYYEHKPLSNLTCYAWMMQIYVLMGQKYLSEHASEADASQGREESNRVIVNRIVEYVENNYTEDITLDRMAEMAGFSKCYFSRVFSKQTGIGFSRFLLKKRIAVAAHLLSTTRLSVVQVSAQSGFSSLSTFNRTFKEIHGCSPSEYRALYAAGQENTGE